MYKKIFLKIIIGVFVCTAFFTITSEVPAHIIPPENFHPVAESYRRMFFILNISGTCIFSYGLSCCLFLSYLSSNNSEYF